MSVTADPYGRELPGVVRTPPPPGEESAGPALSPFVVETFAAIRAELELARLARRENERRTFELFKAGNADANGDLLLELFSVPAGSTGHLTRLCVDTPGSTPAAPITNANLWLAVIALSSAGMTTPPVANRVPLGSMLHCSPNTPAVDAQIPCVLVDSEDAEGSPTLVGPATFYLQVDASTASLAIAARFVVICETPAQ